MPSSSFAPAALRIFTGIASFFRKSRAWRAPTRESIWRNSETFRFCVNKRERFCVGKRRKAHFWTPDGAANAGDGGERHGRRRRRRRAGGRCHGPPRARRRVVYRRVRRGLRAALQAGFPHVRCATTRRGPAHAHHHHARLPSRVFARRPASRLTFSHHPRARRVVLDAHAHMRAAVLPQRRGARHRVAGARARGARRGRARLGRRHDEKARVSARVVDQASGSDEPPKTFHTDCDLVMRGHGHAETPSPRPTSCTRRWRACCTSRTRRAASGVERKVSVRKNAPRRPARRRRALTPRAPRRWRSYPRRNTLLLFEGTGPRGDAPAETFRV